jgi:hypothetical protein
MEEHLAFIERLAEEYAFAIVEDPENHMDAVHAAAEDFIAGAYAAWAVFNKDLEDDAQ